MPGLAEPARGALPTEAESNGCFETMRAYRGRMFRLGAHLDRLDASAKFLGTPGPPQRAALARQVTGALARSGLKEAVVRVALRPSGAASRAYVVVRRIEPPPASAYARGIRVAVVPARALGVGAVSPQAKYSARLGSVLAVADAQLRGADEALFMDQRGYITESTASNFSVIRAGVLCTPPCSLGLLWGITRDVLFELAGRLRLATVEMPLTRHELYTAQEALLSSTIKEVLPVTWIDGRRVGTGRPGPITRRLGEAFHALVRRETRGRSRGW
jgi:branched-chain amino acid aminotransferase